MSFWDNLFNSNLTMVDAGDALTDQMNTGKHNWEPVSAVEHTSRYASDPEYKKNYDMYTKQRIKAYTGWSKDSKGNYHMPAGSAYARISGQEDNLKNFKAPAPNFLQKWKGYTAAGSPKIDAESAQKRVSEGTTAAVTKGITEAATSSQKILNDPAGGVSYAAKKGKLPKWMGSFADMYKNNPTAFWGALVVGGIGISGLVSAFLGSRGNSNQKATTVNNYYYGNNSKMPTSTSYWRAQ